MASPRFLYPTLNLVQGSSAGNLYVFSPAGQIRGSLVSRQTLYGSHSLPGVVSWRSLNGSFNRSGHGPSAGNLYMAPPAGEVRGRQLAISIWLPQQVRSGVVSWHSLYGFPSRLDQGSSAGNLYVITTKRQKVQMFFFIIQRISTHTVQA